MASRKALLFAALGAALVALLPFGGCGLQTGGLAGDDVGASCNVDAHCDDDNPCTVDVCTDAGVCDVTPAPDGYAASQLAGDCATARCAGGQLVEVNDDADAADDGEDCTQDTCDGGKPFHTAKPQGSACATKAGAIGTCSAAGACEAPCGQGASCPDTDGDPCTLEACDVATGTCKVTSLSGVPTPGAAAASGDCRVHVCVAGAATDSPDDSDVLVTPTDCDLELCDGGTPSNPLRDAGSPCSTSGGRVCDGGGVCVECNEPNDCPGIDDDCQVRTCESHACGTVFTPSQTGVPNQIDGDCHQVVCDGQGSSTVIVDDTDTPIDGNPCTSDLCANGAPSNPFEPAETPCPGGLVCNATGQCIGCTLNAQCASPDTCGGGNPGTAHVCGCTKATCASLAMTCGSVPDDGCLKKLDCDDAAKNGAETDVDCGGGGGCATKCNNGKQCAVGSDCASGFCADGVCCNKACGGVCEACSAAKKGAGADGTCEAITLGTDPDVECSDAGAPSCGTTGVCNGAGACQKYAAGTVCTPASCVADTVLPADHCDGNGTCVDSGGASCNGFGCASGQCLAVCQNDAQCSVGYYCGGGACSAKKIGGSACGAANQCQSGFCADGVCCDKACGSLCEACTSAKKGAGANGTCGVIAIGQDPDGECADQGALTCGTDGACNGAGACEKYVAGTVCLPASCSGNTKINTRSCDGVGACVDAGSQGCGTYACAAGACFASCGADAECVASAYCNGAAACVPKKGGGVACGAAHECASSFCADGVCCNAACDGICVACTAAKKGSGNDGTCGSIPSGQDPENECADQGAASCGSIGVCSGSGACKLYSNSTVCQPAGCTGSSATKPDICNGNGTCVDGGVVACGNYTCVAGACLAACAGSGDCASGSFCNLFNQCVVQKTIGQLCGGADECSSGSCVDGFCCDTACAGTCMACNLLGTFGVCTNIPANFQDASPACNGTKACNGSGSCLKQLLQGCSANAECISNHCNGTLCVP